MFEYVTEIVLCEDKTNSTGLTMSDNNILLPKEASPNTFNRLQLASHLCGTGLLRSLPSLTANPAAGGPTPALSSKGAASAASPFFSLGAALETLITHRTQTCNSYESDALEIWQFASWAA